MGNGAGSGAADDETYLFRAMYLWIFSATVEPAYGETANRLKGEEIWT